jgi:NarL family two-component system response regulator LiaR
LAPRGTPSTAPDLEEARRLATSTLSAERGYANYVLGCLALNEKQASSAAQYLGQSYKTGFLRAATLWNIAPRPPNHFLAASVILLDNLIMKRHVLIFGLVGGFLIAILQYSEYRFVIIEHSVEIYTALVAILFAIFGIWLGLRITRRRETIRETIVVREVPVLAEAPEPFTPNTVNQQTLGITARELEILTLIARGFSNREIATQLFVSENTVKTHCGRTFEKLGAARRTQAVRRGKELGLLP